MGDDVSPRVAPAGVSPAPRASTVKAAVPKLVFWLWLTAALPVVAPEGSRAAEPPRFEGPVDPFGLEGDGSARPAFADIDGDGDVDCLMVLGVGYAITLFRNTGTAQRPAFAPRENDPFGITVFPHAWASAFADLDGDGDLDVVVSDARKSLYFFENTGTAQSPAFATPTTNPFGLEPAYSGDRPAPTFADIDDDGDLDAVIANEDADDSGLILFFRNTGTAQSPGFVSLEYDIRLNGYSFPQFVDIDGDGDVDAFLSEEGHPDHAGKIIFFRNTGSAESLAFAPASIDPFGLRAVDNGSDLAFTDIDGDGDLDAFVGGQFGAVTFFPNTGTAHSPAFDGSHVDPFGLTNVLRYAASRFVDIDGDGDLDAFVGNARGATYIPPETYFFPNTGSAENPAFGAPTVNPFGLHFGIFSRPYPAFADVDGDGDLDAFFVDGDGPKTAFFENTGTGEKPAFEGPDFDRFDLTVSDTIELAFTDIDGDGDLDAFGGEYDGSIHLCANTGTAQSPAFAAASADPFGLTDVGDLSTPTFADLDGDGDLDALIGNWSGDTIFFENTGSAQSPAFAAPSADPFGLADVGLSTTPEVADLDGDGDLDVFVGEEGGSIFWLENKVTTRVFFNGFESGDLSAWSRHEP
jgi:hypothetical protein